MRALWWGWMVVVACNSDGELPKEDTDTLAHTDLGDSDAAVDTDRPADTDETDPDTGPRLDSGPRGVDTALGVDADLDGFTADVDCDDGDALVHPGAVERCDGRDDDCDPTTPDVGAWFQPDVGPGVDVTTALRGAGGQPGGYVVQAGVLRLCDDQWRARVVLHDGGRLLGTFDGIIIDGDGDRAVTVPDGHTGVRVERVTLRGAGVQGGAMRAGDDGEVTLSDVTFDRGTSTQGGGLYVGHRADVVLARVTLRNLLADEGGGVWIGEGATVSAQDVVADDVVATGDGGVFFVNRAGTLLADHLQATANGAGRGGAVAARGAALVRCAGCVLTANYADSGGAVFAEEAAAVELLDGAGPWRFQHADLGDGGLLWVSGGDRLRLERVEFSFNHASGQGGALHVVGTTLVTLDDVLLTDNDVFGDGGAAVFVDTVVQGVGVTLTDNRAESDGGALQVHEADLTLTAGAVLRNEASGGQGGGARLQGGEHHFDGVDIQDNLAPHGGGLWADATVALVGGHVYRNEASAGDGGGLTVNGGVVTLTDVDLGAAADDNTPHDLTTASGAFDGGADVSWTCDAAGCR